MALNKIKTGSITDDAVNSDKLGAGSVTNTELNKTAITGQSELAETANDADFTIIYDTSSASLKKVLRSNLKQAGPTISSISPTNTSDTDATETFTISGSGFTVGSNARLIGNTGKIVEFDTVTRTNTTTITATISTSSLSILSEPYDVQVTNGEGIATLLLNQVNFNASPVYVTASGSLGTNTKDIAGSFSVNATDPESAGNVTFELQSGSLPPSYTITNTAAEGGTAIIAGTDGTTSSTTTFNFVLRAVDAASNTSSRAFSIQTRIPVSESFTSSGTFSVPAGTTAVDVLIVAGGGSSSNRGPGNTASGGGGAGGLIFMPSYPVTPEGTITVTVGCGGVSPAANGCGGKRGQDSVFGSPSDGFLVGGVLTAKGGGGGGGYYIIAPAAYDGYGQPGGSGGGGGVGASSGPGTFAPGTTMPGGTATQPTESGNSGAYGFGSNGGFGARQDLARKAGGGGGAAGAGSPYCAAPSSQSAGGIGKAYTIADGTTSVYYSGGGGGGGIATGKQGGQGGGGDGAQDGQGQAGTANRGGGSGGAAASSSNSQAGTNGGKGVVIVRY